MSTLDTLFTEVEPDDRERAFAILSAILATGHLSLGMLERIADAELPALVLPDEQRVTGTVSITPADLTTGTVEALADAIDARMKVRFDEFGRVITKAFADAVERLPRARFATGGSGFPEEALQLLRQIAAGGGVGPVVPVGALLTEDGDALLTEDGSYVLTED